MSVLLQKHLEPDITRTSTLKIKSLEAGYGACRVVAGINLELQQGDKILLAGPNGCGKSTFIKAIIGQADIFQGDVILKGHSLLKLPTEKRIAHGLAYLPQHRNVFTSLTVEENMRLSHMHQSVSDRAQALSFLFETFPFLQDKLQTRAGTLSGGERQALAMGIAVRPEAVVYLLDEPCAGLSPKAADTILQGIRILQKRLGFAFIIVEHNLKFVCDWMDRALIMSKGEVVEETTEVAELLKREVLEKHFFHDK